MTFVTRLVRLVVMMQSLRPIMVVDDEPDITYVIKKFFQINGILVDSYNDAEEALSHFKRGMYELLLLDIGMPKMNGFELYREIRKLDEEVKVCFLSAYETYDSCTDSTAFRCIMRKPIGLADLVKHVRLEVAPLVAYR